MSGPRQFFTRTLAALLPERWARGLMRKEIEELRGALEGQLIDKFLEALLAGMSMAFLVLGSYRRNIKGFKGAYLFRTVKGRVAAGARFESGRMTLLPTEVPAYDVAVTFNDPAALRRFLFSRDQDILASILANDVSVDGNLNYVYKFGFLARDLTNRLGLPS
jgi:hypothetical protein